MFQKKYREPDGYEPPRSVEELLDRYSRGERYFVGAQLQCEVFKNHPPLENVNLARADLTRAYAKYASFFGVDFTRSTCVGANFEKAALHRCSFAQADLRGAWLYNTRIAFVSFFAANMEEINYHQTVAARGPDQAMLEAGLASVTPGSASCFVSYSHHDAFAGQVADRLHREGIPNWFMPNSSYFDAYLSENLQLAIQMCDVFALILTDHAIASRWVEDEVTSAARSRAKSGTPRVLVLQTDPTQLPTEKPWSDLEHAESIDCRDPRRGLDELVGLLA